MFGYVFVAAIILVGVSVVQVGAQIPAVCANNANLQARECCPTTPSGVCGGSRGSCVSVSTLCKTDYSSPMLSSSEDLNRYFTEDGRFNWPSQIFDRVCQCHGNYGGYDCLDCKFGYGGNDCNNKLTNRVRRSIATLSDDWPAYIEQLKKAKHGPYSRYKVYIGDNLMDEASYVNVSLYDTFAWIHHYVSRTHRVLDYNKGQSALDYAHESVGFLTWHRLYLLWLEREMQYVLNDAQFTLRYWDWTTQDGRNAFFVAGRLGASSSPNGIVTGALMNTPKWYSVCKGDKTNDKSVCNPKIDRDNTGIIRCKNATKCNPTFKDWPDSQSARRCLMIDQFRRYTMISNKYDKASFSNYLEGFAIDKLCDNGDALCNANLIPGGKFPRSLHNEVHNLLDGTMGDVPIASNDPVFINHHTMIDCIFEQWLRNHPLPNRKYPAQLRPEFAGHAAGDCIVPFIPVHSHSYFFNRISDDFGYNCDLPSFLSDLPTAGTTGTTTAQPTTPNSTATTAESVTLLFSLIVVCLCIIIL